MAGTAYHMETLRKARVIERKAEAMRKLQESALGQSGLGAGEIYDRKQAPLVYSEPGHIVPRRCSKGASLMKISKDDVVFEDVVHDPNFKYRMLKEVGGSPQHVDPIYGIMYPGSRTARK